MKNNTLLSVIIPVYNSSYYIEKCLNSILNQEYKNFEIIIVDDGSTDNSLDICKKIAERNNKIKIYHQENSGPSSARNLALEKATGEYITFLDSDDKFEKNCFTKCINVINKYNPDIIKFGLIKKIKFLKKRNKFDLPKNHIILKNNYNELFPKLLTYNLRNVCGTIIKKKIITNLKFDEKLLIAEDSMFFFNSLIKSNSFYYLDDELYIYNINYNSLTHKFDQNITLKKLKDSLYVNNIIESYLANHIDKIDNQINLSEIKFSINNCIKQSNYKEYLNFIIKIKTDENIKAYMKNFNNWKNISCLNYKHNNYLFHKFLLLAKEKILNFLSF